MIIKTLAELQQPDEGSLKFSPWGLGGRMKPEDAARWQQEAVARYEISVQAPETTRLSFERVRTIFSYGVMCYELYTVAGDQARLAMEQALRDRFLPFYSGVVPFIDAKGDPQSITADNWQQFLDELNSGGRLRKPKNWKLKPASERPAFRFDGMLDSLLKWAWAEKLLAGQRDRLRDRPRVKLRNFVAHATYHLGMPPDAERAIADLAELINRIWGAPSGAPLDREICIIGWDQRGVTWGRAEAFSADPLADPEACVVVRAARLEDLGSYDSLYEAVPSPCDYLWGPGARAEAQDWLAEHQPEGDQAQILERLFVLRYDDSRLYLPQTLPVAAGLEAANATGTWYLIRADSPSDAFGHQLQRLVQLSEHTSSGHCTCPVEALGEGSLQDVLARAAAIGANVAPAQVPDTRVTTSWTPRSHIIHPGAGSEIPPDDPSRARFVGGQA
jgi:hypothetical protein